MKSKSTFLRRLILYGFVYDLDYSELREYNYTLGKISGNHICCVVTNRCSTRYSSIFRLAYDYLSGAKFLRYLTAGVIKTAALFFKATVR